MLRRLSKLSQDCFSLLFPALCAACNQSLKQGEDQICLHCENDLPYTDFQHYADNPLAKQFWGRQEVHSAMALLYFHKSSRTQHLIHQLKYRNQPDIGTLLGRKIGERLDQNPLTQHIDLIIPVPLHRGRQRSRGYNQSEYLAKGIAQVLQVPINTNVLRRSKATASQTHKDRYTRSENLQQVFSLQSSYKWFQKDTAAQALRGKHLLLVDDVVTTGATLEACMMTLRQANPAAISIAAAAYTA